MVAGYVFGVVLMQQQKQDSVSNKMIHRNWNKQFHIQQIQDQFMVILPKTNPFVNEFLFWEVPPVWLHSYHLISCGLGSVEVQSFVVETTTIWQID